MTFLIAGYYRFDGMRSISSSGWLCDLRQQQFESWFSLRIWHSNFSRALPDSYSSICSKFACSNLLASKSNNLQQPTTFSIIDYSDSTNPEKFWYSASTFCLFSVGHVRNKLRNLRQHICWISLWYSSPPFSFCWFLLSIRKSKFG